MKIHRARLDLLSFMTQNRQDKGQDCAELVKMASRELAPLFEAAEKSDYLLASDPSKALWAETRGVIGEAINGSIIRVEPVSVSQPFPRPNWMSKEWHKKSFAESLQASIGMSLGDILRDRFGGDYWDQLEKRKRHQQTGFVNTNPILHLLDGLGRCLAKQYGIEFDLSPNLGSSILYLTSFAMTGNQRKVEDIKHLIRIGRGGILPLG